MCNIRWKAEASRGTAPRHCQARRQHLQPRDTADRDGNVVRPRDTAQPDANAFKGIHDLCLNMNMDADTLHSTLHSETATPLHCRARRQPRHCPARRQHLYTAERNGNTFGEPDGNTFQGIKVEASRGTAPRHCRLPPRKKSMPLPSGEGTTYTVLKTFVQKWLKPWPVSGRDCLLYSEFRVQVEG